MPRRTRTLSPAVSVKLGELALAAPQVVAHRLARLALAGPHPSARDRAEFARMVREKQLAFAQSWLAMWAEGLRVQQGLWLAWARAPAPGRRAAARWVADGLRIGARGLSPVHAKAVANARRLSRTRLR